MARTRRVSKGSSKVQRAIKSLNKHRVCARHPNKIRYNKKKGLKAVAKKGGSLYRCPTCKSWHRTSKE